MGGPTYVTAESVEALRRLRGTRARRRLRAPGAGTPLDAIDQLVGALRDEREATVRALTEREAARVELASAQAELELLRQLAGLAAGDTPLPSDLEPSRQPLAPAEAVAALDISPGARSSAPVPTEVAE
jgi:hypothetical protein